MNKSLGRDVNDIVSPTFATNAAAGLARVAGISDGAGGCTGD
ncbi:MAG: hypothetical protein WC455_26055 [Dehalococcoidia bacterium]